MRPSVTYRTLALSAILKVAAAPDFRDSQIVGKMIHHMDEALAVSSGGFESRLRRLSGSPEGARRQYCDGGFRPFGLRNVFHAERFFPVLSTRSGERPGPIKLPEPVRHRENSVRQLHPRHARRSGPGAARTLLRASGSSAGRAAVAPGFRQTGGAERWSPGMEPSSFARKSSAARIASRASAPTARLSRITPCWRRRWSRRAMPKSYL